MTQAVPALLFLVIALAAFAVFIGVRAGHDSRPRDPYRIKPRLLSRAETNAFRVLLLAKPPELLLLASVRLADVIQPAVARRNHSAYRTQLNRIIQKQLDFVLCDPNTTRPLLAIELQDASHNSEKRRQRDRFVSEALYAAGLPLLFIRASGTYQVAELRSTIKEMLDCNKTA